MRFNNIDQAMAIPKLKPIAVMMATIWSLLSFHLTEAGESARSKTLREGEAESQAETEELPVVNVTARRSTEREKDVPFGVSVIDESEIEKFRMLNLENTLRATPGVNVNSFGDPNSTNVMIRGIGSLNQVSMDDGSVGLNVDGVAMSMRSLSLGTLDVERVEVLKGAQGTLFGGNSMAGVINVTTHKPTRDIERRVRAEFGQYNQHLEEAILSGPLSDQLSGRFAIRNTGSDHWIDNTQTGNPLSKPRDWAFRGSLLWDNYTGSSALLTVEQQTIERMPNLIVLQPYGHRPNSDFTPGIFDQDRKTLDRYSVEINHNLTSSRITSITAYTNTQYQATSGYDRKTMLAAYGVPAENVYDSDSKQHVISEDLRLASLPEAPFFWVTGLNFSDSHRTFDTTTSAYRRDRNYDNQSYAAYGEITYPLTEVVKLTGGARYSMDKKAYRADYTSGSSVISDRRKLHDGYTTERVALSYDFSTSTNFYSAFSHGYQSGGFADFTTQVTDSEPYKAAKSKMFEFGFKSASTDGLLKLNGAVYITKVQDAHLLGYDSITTATNTINADTESKGVEFEGIWKFADNFLLSGSISYIDAEITSNAIGVYGGDVTSGNRVPDVPHWSSRVSASYRKNLPSMLGVSTPMINAAISYQYMGERAADPQNRVDLASYQKVDMRTGLTLKNIEIYAFADNLLNEKYDLYGYYLTAAATVGAPARGRTVGVGFNYYF